MDAVQVYWRDMSIKLASWGTGILIVVAGWAFFKSQEFGLFDYLHPRERLRALALLVFAFGGTVSWYIALRWIYKRHLSTGVDGTVISWWLVRTYAVVVILCTWLLALITAIL